MIQKGDFTRKFLATAIALGLHQAAMGDTQLPVVVVTAPYPVRSLNAIDDDAIRDATPGTTPVKLLGQIAGVNYTGADGFGAYEWANDFSLRGFTSGQVGFMLDNIPLGSTHFWYNSGIEAHRAIDSENLEHISVIPGSGALGVAANNALGAAVLVKSSDPEEQFGIRAKQTIGSNNARRTFARLDTGQLESDTKAYFSFSSSSSDKWKGMGSSGQDPLAFFSRDSGYAVTGAGARWGNYHEQINIKAEQKVGDHLITLFYDYSDKRENDYADLTLPVYQKYGRYFDNYTNWRDALKDTDENAYYGSAASWRQDHLFALNGKFRLSQAAQLEITPYYHTDKGTGDWHMPFSDDTGMTDMKFRRGTYDVTRSGVNSKFGIDLGDHKLAAGLWLEENRLQRQRFYYDLYDWRNSPATDLSQPSTTLLDRFYRTNTTQAYVRDDIRLSNNGILLSLGVKAMRVKTDFTDNLNAYPNNSLVAEKSFLPQIGVNWPIQKGQEVFAYYAENISAMPITAFTTRSFNPNLAPEESKTLEVGWRGQTRDWQTAVSVYTIAYRNRALQIANCTLLGTCPSLLANVGNVRTEGMEASINWLIGSGFHWRNVLSYNESRYLDDYMSGGKTVPTAGKYVINAPRAQWGTELGWRSGSYFANLTGKYTDERYASYTNDLKLPTFILWGLSAGYHQKGWLGLNDFRVQLNVENLFDKDYLSTIGSSGIYASDPTGANTYFQVGAPRLIYLSMEGIY